MEHQTRRNVREALPPIAALPATQPTHVHHTGASCYAPKIATKRKSIAAKSVRQSVTIPSTLISEIRHVAKERHLTTSRMLVALAERGLQANAEAKEQLKTSSSRFLKEKDPALKNEAGKDLIRTIFGADSIAEDTVL